MDINDDAASFDNNRCENGNRSQASLSICSESKLQKSSILKPSKARPPLQDLNFYCDGNDDEDFEPMRKRKVSFHHVNNIKEFCPSSETLKICNTSAYEETLSSESSNFSRGSSKTSFMAIAMETTKIQPHGGTRVDSDDLMDISDSLIAMEETAGAQMNVSNVSLTADELKDFALDNSLLCEGISQILENADKKSFLKNVNFNSESVLDMSTALFDVNKDSNHLDVSGKESVSAPCQRKSIAMDITQISETRYETSPEAEDLNVSPESEMAFTRVVECSESRPLDTTERGAVPLEETFSIGRQPEGQAPIIPDAINVMSLTNVSNFCDALNADEPKQTNASDTTSEESKVEKSTLGLLSDESRVARLLQTTITPRISSVVTTERPNINAELSLCSSVMDMSMVTDLRPVVQQQPILRDFEHLNQENDSGSDPAFFRDSISSEHIERPLKRDILLTLPPASSRNCSPQLQQVLFSQGDDDMSFTQVLPIKKIRDSSMEETRVVAVQSDSPAAPSPELNNLEVSVTVDSFQLTEGVSLLLDEANKTNFGPTEDCGTGSMCISGRASSVENIPKSSMEDIPDVSFSPSDAISVMRNATANESQPNELIPSTEQISVMSSSSVPIVEYETLTNVNDENMPPPLLPLCDTSRIQTNSAQVDESASMIETDTITPSNDVPSVLTGIEPLAGEFESPDENCLQMEISSVMAHHLNTTELSPPTPSSLPQLSDSTKSIVGPSLTEHLPVDETTCSAVRLGAVEPEAVGNDMDVDVPMDEEEPASAINSSIQSAKPEIESTTPVHSRCTSEKNCETRIVNETTTPIHLPPVTSTRVNSASVAACSRTEPKPQLKYSDFGFKPRRLTLNFSMDRTVLPESPEKCHADSNSPTDCFQVVDQPYEVRVGNRMFMAKFGMERVDLDEWRWPIRRGLLNLIVKSPLAPLDESTQPLAFSYEINQEKSDPVTLFLAAKMQQSYSDKWLVARCNTLKDLNIILNTLRRKITFLKPLCCALYHVALRYPCSISENALQFTIVDLKSVVKFDVIVNLRNWCNISGTDISISNKIGNVNENMVRLMFNDIEKDDKVFLSFINKLRKYIDRLLI